MAALGKYIHSKGLLYGLYSCAGFKTCAGRPGSLGYEKVDASTYAIWEYFYPYLGSIISSTITAMMITPHQRYDTQSWETRWTPQVDASSSPCASGAKRILGFGRSQLETAGGRLAILVQNTVQWWGFWTSRRDYRSTLSLAHGMILTCCKLATDSWLMTSTKPTSPSGPPWNHHYSLVATWRASLKALSPSLGIRKSSRSTRILLACRLISSTMRNRSAITAKCGADSWVKAGMLSSASIASK